MSKKVGGMEESALGSSDRTSIAPPAEPSPQPAARSVESPTSGAAAVAGSSPTVLDLINALADKADPIVKLMSTSFDRYQKGQEREIKFQIHMAWVAVSVVFLIIGVAAWLTYLGKVDGSTFTFLLGLIVGYVLTFIRDQIRSPES